MKQIIQNRQLSLTVRIVLTVLAVLLVAGFAFLQGMFYANRKATIQMANDECFYTVYALRALKDPEQRRVAVLFETGMDSAALKLAEMCLRYPHDIKRTHYNVLVRVRDYRKQYGRDPTATSDIDVRELDKKVAEAIAYLESIHDMKEWVPYKFDFDTGKVKAE
jgi:hypothetical protein